MNIEELMEKLPEGYLIVSMRVDVNKYRLGYYKNKYDFYEHPADHVQQPNETFTQFIQRVVENEFRKVC